MSLCDRMNRSKTCRLLKVGRFLPLINFRHTSMVINRFVTFPFWKDAAFPVAMQAVDEMFVGFPSESGGPHLLPNPGSKSSNQAWSETGLFVRIAVATASNAWAKVWPEALSLKK